MKRGYFITFEGVDGSGKSTQINALKRYLEAEGYEVVLTREPGGTDVGEQIRALLLDPRNVMTAMTEAMLYAASRAQHVAEVVEPALSRGNIVICDRFLDSSVAYQGYGRGLGEIVYDVNRWAVGNLVPDMTVFLDISPESGNGRMAERIRDRIENESNDFHDAVYSGYISLLDRYPDRIVRVDARRPIQEIQDDIVEKVDELLNGLRST